jgi:hypothetical protein
VASFAGYTIHLFDKLSPKNIPFIFAVAGGVLYVLFGVLKLPLLLPLIYIAVYFLKIADIKFEAQLQHSMSSNQRATIFSIKSVGVEVIYMGLILLFGFIGENFGLSTILIISGAIVVITSLIYWHLITKYWDPHY